MRRVVFAVLPLCAALAASPAGAASLAGRLPLDAAERRAVEAACGEDALCTARWLVRHDPTRFRLIRRPPPDTDRIRWVESTPSLGRVERLEGGLLLVELRGFGRTLWHELRAAVPAGARVVLDLRDNAGGDLERMLHLAARLLGPRRARILLESRSGGRRALAAEPAPLPAFRVAAVLVGPHTASSAEILAALLKRAGVPLCGKRTYGKDRVEADLPVAGALHLRATIGRVRVPGVHLAGGITPDAPLAACPVSARADPSGGA